MTLTITAAPDTVELNAVRVDVASSPAVLDSITVWRVHQNGERFRVLVERNADTIAGGWTAMDHHAPLDEPISYAAETGSGQTGQGGATYLPSMPGPGWDGWGWLTTPEGTSLAVPILAGAPPAVTRKPQVEKTQVHGRRRRVVKVLGRRSGVSSSLSVLCRTDEDAVALWDLLTDGGPLLLRTTFRPPAIRWAWIQPDSDELAWPSERIGDDLRTIGFQFEEVEQPDWDVRPALTVGEHAALGLTVAQSAAMFDTVADLKYNRRTP